MVRKRLICLPQDSLLLSGTVASILDSEGLTSHAQIQSVLKQVQLWALVTERGGIEAELQPDTLSHGERQLLATAKAVLRNRQHQGRGILILDEATSNLDSVTAAVIHKVIENEFKGQTVITIAHRAEALKCCDLIVELHEGRVARMGSAEEILHAK